MKLFSLKDLNSALSLIKESEESELKIQKDMQRRLSKYSSSRVENDLDEDEEPAGDEEPDAEPQDSSQEDSEEEPAGDAGKEKDKKLAGADEINSTVQELPKEMKGSDFLDKVNKIRAGTSLKDPETQTRIFDYVKALTDNERKDLWINLDSLARIILGGTDAARVMTPSLLKGPEDNESSPDEVEKVSAPVKVQGNSPIVAVNEGWRLQKSRAAYTLESGKKVSFGHPSHIRELEKAHKLLTRILNHQEGGSASRAAISSARREISKQLEDAMKSFDHEKQIDGSKESKKQILEKEK